MATSYKTPGVYINEVSALPASVAQVPTAIPAFLGYTEFATELDGSSLTGIPKRIISMVEYAQFFGGSAMPSATLGSADPPKVILDESNGFSVSEIQITLKYVMYQSLSLYFANGGGACYIVSVGGYDYNRADADVDTDITEGLAALASEDEPTLLLAPDAALMFEAGNDMKLGNLQKKMLIQCNKLQDRFTIMDLIEDAASNDLGEANFRDEVGVQYLKYGAAYCPHLETSLSYNLQFSDLVIEEKDTPGVPDTSMLNGPAVLAIQDAKADLGLIEALTNGVNNLNGFNAIASSTKGNLISKVNIIKNIGQSIRDLVSGVVIKNTDIRAKIIQESVVGSKLEAIIKKSYSYDIGYPLPVGTPVELGSIVVADFNGSDIASPPATYDFNYLLGVVVANAQAYGGQTTIAPAVASATNYYRSLLIDLLAIVEDLEAEAKRILSLLEESLVSVDPIYAGIKRAIAAKGIIVPPSGAVAGAYVATDGNRGVWKAPANVILNNVVKPTIKVDNATQENLNVHATSGKSINVIRSFTGKGVLIWGARTLAGNDNEWRYVPVRRLFITVEESVKKATEFVVFEPNDGNTWLRTKTMIQNYLTGLWRQGALAGAKPEDAFFVNVGLGSTMTAQDILEGKLIVEIGLAAVRPAEFIILRFSHKLQES